MKILVTGKSDFTYNRTQILLAGLKELDGVELDFYPIERGKFKKAELKERSGRADIVYIPPMRHSDVRLVKSLVKAPVVFDALISKYLTRTVDHGKWWTRMEKEWRDRTAFNHSDLIIMDTEGHRNFIVQKYKINPSRVISIPVGVDPNLFYPSQQPNEDHYTVGFYGGFIPLQGVDKIVKAASLLSSDPTVRFTIIGKGPDFKQVTKLARKLNATNVDFLGWLPYEELNARINSFDLCLGIFGDSIKADLVVPNKLYHYSALRKCTITKNTVGLNEVYTPGRDIVGVGGSPEEIARAITELRADEERKEMIARNGYDLIVKDYNHKRIAGVFIEKVTNSLFRA